MNVTKTFQNYCPVEDRPITSEDFCAPIKKRPLHFILGKGERIQRALGLGSGPQCHRVPLGKTLSGSGPQLTQQENEGGGRWSLSSQHEKTLVVDFLRELQLPVLARGNFSRGGADQALVPWRSPWGVRSGRSTMCLGGREPGLARARCVSSRSRSQPRQCPRGSSSTGIPGQTGSPTASLQGEDRGGEQLEKPSGTSHRRKRSPFRDGDPGTCLGGR